MFYFVLFFNVLQVVLFSVFKIIVYFLVTVDMRYYYISFRCRPRSTVVLGLEVPSRGHTVNSGLLLLVPGRGPLSKSMGAGG